MQALARVNRRFRGKQDGLLVGYAPLTDNLRKALAEYTPSDQEDQTLGRDVDRAITEVRNEHATLCGLLAGIDWRALLADTSYPECTVARLAAGDRPPARPLQSPAVRSIPAPRLSPTGTRTVPPVWSASTGCAR
jgi:hypothetical protein